MVQNGTTACLTLEKRFWIVTAPLPCPEEVVATALCKLQHFCCDDASAKGTGVKDAERMKALSPSLLKYFTLEPREQKQINSQKKMIRGDSWWNDLPRNIGLIPSLK